MKKVLIISYQFPPLAGPGVFKTLKFTKYLPKFGFKPIILTVKESKIIKKDETLLNEIPDIVKIYKTLTFESKIIKFAPSFFGFNNKWYQIPDSYFSWFPFAILKAKEILKKEKPEIIYSSSPPITSHLIALQLKKKTRIPWVADFRDPWTDNITIKYPTKLHFNIEKNLERKILKYADKIIFTMDRHKDHISKKYPDISSDKYTIITNGYDVEDFKDKNIKKFSKFTLSYIGSFYGIRTPIYFLKGLEKAVSENKNLKKDLQVIFAGNYSNEYSKLINEYKLENIIKEIGFVTHKKAIELMMNSTCLVFIIGIGKKSEWIYSLKIYEYIASGTPIIATVPKKSAVKKLINETKAGVILDTDDIDGIRNIILDYYDKWKNNQIINKPRWDEIHKYNRKELTKKLVETFNELKI